LHLKICNFLLIILGDEGDGVMYEPDLEKRYQVPSGAFELPDIATDSKSTLQPGEPGRKPATIHN